MSDVTPYPKPAPRAPKPRKRLRWQSPKRAAEKPLRDAVRAAAAIRDQGCVGPARGLPGPCGAVGERWQLEVHETRARGTHPGSHLRLDSTALLCPIHHDAVTSPSGEARAIAEASGLLVRFQALTDPIEPARARLGDMDGPIRGWESRPRTTPMTS